MSVVPLDPAPPACPLCGGDRWIVRRFFEAGGTRWPEGLYVAGRFVPLKSPWLVEPVVAILAECDGCGLLRFFPPAGHELPVEARARDLPSAVAAESGRESSLVVAASGTTLPPRGGATTWTNGIPAGTVAAIHLWLSLEECSDPVAALLGLRASLHPGGTLTVAAVDGRRWRRMAEPGRHRILYGPAHLARVLELGGFTATVRRSWLNATLLAEATPAP